MTSFNKTRLKPIEPQQYKMKNAQNLQNQSKLFFDKVFAHKFLLAGLLVLGMGLGYASSFFAKTLYEAKTVLYAPQATSTEKSLYQQEFGYDIDAERLMQVLQANRLKRALQQEFDLITHYDIDTTRSGWQRTFNKTFEKRFRFNKTRYMSVEISVLDTDAKKALQMSHFLIEQMEQFRSDLMKKNLANSYSHIKREYLERSNSIDSLVDSIKALRERNRIAFKDDQQAVRQDKRTEIKEIQQKIEGLRKEFGLAEESEALINLLKQSVITAKSKEKSEQAKIDYLSNIKPDDDTAIINARARKSAAAAQVNYLEAEIQAILPALTPLSELLDEYKNAKELKRQINYELSMKLIGIDPTIESFELHELNQRFKQEMDLFEELKEKYYRVKLAYEEPLPQSFIISQPETDFRAASPKRSIFALAGGLFFIGMGLVYVIQKEGNA